jgi:S-adenosylmethionine:tRNA ribosyltransferase-isomerase
MRTADFDFELPAELIAQTPAAQRDASRLFVLHRSSGRFEHRTFRDLVDYVRPGDVLVLNDSRVIPARLHGVNAQTGGQFEMLLVEETELNDWWAMLRPGKRAREGTRIALFDSKGMPGPVQAILVEKNSEGHCRLRFEGVPNIREVLDEFGEVPLPPYIERNEAGDHTDDRERYQTVFARPPGSVAAPTAGLHFTELLLNTIRQRGVQVCFVTLHVGLGTFAPVKTENVAAHVIHEENYQLSDQTAETINRAKAAGGRVIAVGTTTVRVLETIVGQPFQAAGSGRFPAPRFESGPSQEDPLLVAPGTGSFAAGPVTPGSGRTRIFIYPPYDFKIADALLTNFHLPRSTLLMLVSAFAAPGSTVGRERILSAYGEAVRQQYRFFSYGDAMLIT